MAQECAVSCTGSEASLRLNPPPVAEGVDLQVQAQCSLQPRKKHPRKELPSQGAAHPAAAGCPHPGEAEGSQGMSQRVPGACAQQAAPFQPVLSHHGLHPEGQP